MARYEELQKQLAEAQVRVRGGGVPGAGVERLDTSPCNSTGQPSPTNHPIKNAPLSNPQAAAAEEEEELELARAAAAVARLTAPDSPAGASPPPPATASYTDTDEYVQGLSPSALQGEGDDGEPPAGPAAAKLKRLQEQVLDMRDEVHIGGDEEGDAAPPLTKLH